MSYRQVFFGVAPSLGIAPVLEAVSGALRDHRPDLGVRTVYLRSLDDDAARDAGVRWLWIAVDASHGRVFTREALAFSLRDRLKDLIEIVHDDSRGAYAFASGDLALCSLRGLLSGERHLVTIDHPQAGLSNAELARRELVDAPNAVVLGLRQRWAEASTEPRAYLQLLTSGVTHRFAVSDPSSPVRDEAPPPLAGYLDPWLEARELPTEDEPLRAAEEVIAERTRWARVRALAIETDAALKTGALDEADARARELLALSPTDTTGWQTVVAIATQRGELDAALALAREWVGVTPRDRFAWETLIDIEIRRGDHARAFEGLREGLDAAGTLDGALARLMRALSARPQPDLRREVVEWAGAHGFRPDLIADDAPMTSTVDHGATPTQRVDALLERAEMLSYAGAYEDAIACAADVLALVPDEERAWKRLITIQSLAQDPAATFARIRQAATAMGDKRGALRSDVSRVMQRADTALLREVVAWTRAVGIEPGDIAHYERKLATTSPPRHPRARPRWQPSDVAVIALGLAVALFLVLYLMR